VTPDRRAPFVSAPEQAALVSFLDYLRESIVVKAVGLTPSESRRALVGSGTNLIGMVQHLTMAETFWFVHTFAGLDDPVPDPSMTVPDHVTDTEVVADYRAATARSNQIAAEAADGDALSARAYRETEERLSLRWVLVHMIEETARHAGHADILREQIDGTTGR